MFWGYNTVFAKFRLWLQTRHRLEHGADLGVPEPEKGISRSASQSWLAVFQGWQVVRTFDTATGPFAETGLGGSDRLRMVATKIHE